MGGASWHCFFIRLGRRSSSIAVAETPTTILTLSPASLNLGLSFERYLINRIRLQGRPLLGALQSCLAPEACVETTSWLRLELAIVANEQVFSPVWTCLVSSGKQSKHWVSVTLLSTEEEDSNITQHNNIKPNATYGRISLVHRSKALYNVVLDFCLGIALQ